MYPLFRFARCRDGVFAGKTAEAVTVFSIQGFQKSLGADKGQAVGADGSANFFHTVGIADQVLPVGVSIPK